MDETNKNSEQPLIPSGLTRREWLVNFGSAIVLSGFPGTLAEATQESRGAAAPLPPGLYQPSLDHLTHALASEAAFVPVPPGSETEYVQPRSGPFVPQAFAPQQFAMVRRLVELILGEDLRNSSPAPPKTGHVPASLPPHSAPAANIYDEIAEWIDLVVTSAPQVRAAARNLSPEHRAVAVAYFGSEQPISQLESFEPERVCREGLAWLDEESHRRVAKGFLEISDAEQTEIVRSISDARADLTAVHAGTYLFDFLKAECIRGFYTSRAGLKELDYKANAFHAASPGCSLGPE